jgi:hypothetical protein
MKSITMHALQKLLEAAIASHKESVASFEGDQNPQVIEMRQRAESRLEAYESVYEATRGRTVLLRILAKLPAA